MCIFVNWFHEETSACRRFVADLLFFCIYFFEVEMAKTTFLKACVRSLSCVSRLGVGISCYRVSNITQDDCRRASKNLCFHSLYRKLSSPNEKNIYLRRFFFLFTDHDVTENLFIHFLESCFHRSRSLDSLKHLLPLNSCDCYGMFSLYTACKVVWVLLYNKGLLISNVEVVHFVWRCCF